ncbi:MAG: CDP-glucose 4,6-dehydratase [bacterium]|nr:CDP-glucose 4,6-dehydratase [bacterium]
MFQNHYKNKVVFVTGHTGFKGAWLTQWLLELGAKVVGFSVDIPTTPSLFEALDLESQITHIVGDVRHLSAVKSALNDTKPDMLFHLAAQPLVKLSYDDPVATFETNVLGMLNVLEAGRTCESLKQMVLITSDKCYQNVEWEWGYRETDALGGDDPYSGSKGAAELVARSYMASYYKNDSAPRVAITRAGNVIGGGDWAKDRIIPDSVRAWSQGETVKIRSPKATRPWQHVLEPLSGYLHLGACLATQPECHGEPFNFGPNSQVNESVEVLLDAFGAHWDKAQWALEGTPPVAHENTLLKLCCDKALHYLEWQAVWGFSDTIKTTAQWYGNYYTNPDATPSLTKAQIQHYVESATQKGITWTA